jgi:hypothetical protein
MAKPNSQSTISTSNMHSDTYDQGFYDAIKFVTQHLRVAADQVAQRRQIHYATKLRELADELERIITQ